MTRDRIADLARDLASEPRVTIDCGGVMRADREQVILAALRFFVANTADTWPAPVLLEGAPAFCRNCRQIVDAGRHGNLDADGHVVTCNYCPAGDEDDDATRAADLSEDAELERDA